MRAAIAALPDGTYAFEDFLDNDGITDAALRIALDMTITGDALHLDFSRSAAACAGPLNIARATAIACCYVALKHAFPEVPAKATYNSFYRYRALHDYIQGHPEKFSFNDARHALTLVQAHTHDADEGAAFPTPCRTMWPLVWDMTKRTVEVSFYLKDGNVDTATGVPQLLFSEPFTFTLKANPSSAVVKFQRPDIR